jgi:glucosamine--fructose-6-phosphate aminotransferase (isomerizing)
MPNPNGVAAEGSSPFRYFMLKEIYDQPEAIEQTIRHHLGEDGSIRLDREPMTHEGVRSLKRVSIVASGASRHAGMAGRVMIEDLVSIPVGVEHASEYCYRKPVTDGAELTIVITQSGETGDTIAAQRTAKEAGLTTLAISNVAESTIVREADGALLTFAGKEVAIPATKSFTTQLIALYLFTLYLASVREALSRAEVARSVAELQRLPETMRRVLESMDKQAELVAKSYFQDQSFLVLGRAVHQPIALEAALKLKEISYIHAEGYATGELRHGPTALVGESTPVIVIATRDEADKGSMLRYEKTVALVEELRPRSERMILVATEGDKWAEGFGAANVLTVPPAPELLLPVLEVLPLQLLSYHVALFNNLDVDRPRNLVKSVRQD